MIITTFYKKEKSRENKVTNIVFIVKAIKTIFIKINRLVTGLGT